MNATIDCLLNNACVPVDLDCYHSNDRLECWNTRYLSALLSSSRRIAFGIVAVHELLVTKMNNVPVGLPLLHIPNSVPSDKHVHPIMGGKIWPVLVVQVFASVVPI